MDAAPQASPDAPLPAPAPAPAPVRTAADPFDVLWAVLSILLLNAGALVPLMVMGVADPSSADFGLRWFPVDMVITLAMAWVFGCRRYGRSLREGWSYWPVPGRVLGLGALLGLACVTAAILMPDSGVQSPMHKIVTAYLQRPAGGVLMMVTAVLAAIMEETYYRGFIYTALARSWGRIAAGVVVVIWFTALHVPQLAGDWRAIATVGLMGITVTVLRIRTGSTLPGLVTHVVYNVSLTAPTAISLLLKKG